MDGNKRVSGFASTLFVLINHRGKHLTKPLSSRHILVSHWPALGCLLWFRGGRASVMTAFISQSWAYCIWNEIKGLLARESLLQTHSYKHSCCQGTNRGPCESCSGWGVGVSMSPFLVLPCFSRGTLLTASVSQGSFKPASFLAKPIWVWHNISSVKSISPFTRNMNTCFREHTAQSLAGNSIDNKSVDFYWE